MTCKAVTGFSLEWIFVDLRLVSRVVFLTLLLEDGSWALHQPPWIIASYLPLEFLATQIIPSLELLMVWTYFPCRKFTKTVTAMEKISQANSAGAEPLMGRSRG